MEIKYLYTESATGNDFTIVTRSWLRLYRDQTLLIPLKWKMYPRLRKTRLMKFNLLSIYYIVGLQTFSKMMSSMWQVSGLP